MNMSEFRKIAWNGLWKQNTGLVQLLGLCPILAISTTMVNGVSLGLATVFVMAIVNLSIALLRNYIPYQVRIPVFIMIIATAVAVVDMCFNAYLHELYLILGIFIPLIATNCIVLARVEAFASKNPPLASTVDGIMMGLGLVWVLGLLGSLRELIGNGTLLGGIDMIFPGMSPIAVFGEDYPGVLLAILPPGAFFTLGCLIALFNLVNSRATTYRSVQQSKSAPATPAIAQDVPSGG